MGLLGRVAAAVVVAGFLFTGLALLFAHSARKDGYFTPAASEARTWSIIGLVVAVAGWVTAFAAREKADKPESVSTVVYVAMWATAVAFLTVLYALPARD